MLSKDHPYTLVSMNSLAYTLQDQGPSYEAYLLIETCVKAKK